MRAGSLQAVFVMDANYASAQTFATNSTGATRKLSMRMFF